MKQELKGIESAASNLARYLQEHGDSADLSLIVAQAALISERAKDLISTKHETAGDLVTHG